MSIPKITGREARELLDIWSGDDEGLTFAQLGADRSYGDLFGAAPALAETVAWLYGMPAQRSWDHIRYWWETTDDRADVAASKGTVSCFCAVGDQAAPLTPDEAVDLARALLAAAEEARS